jgi:outer membrane beta-barrel protein
MTLFQKRPGERMNTVALIKFILLIALFAICEGAVAQTIYIPDEELPSEAISPRLDSPSAVIDRRVQLQRRWEMQIKAGILLDEVIYEPSYYGIGLAYHSSEVSGWGLFYQKFGSGITDTASAFESTSASLKFDRAPAGPNDGYGLSYFHRFFYGKISITQASTLPLIFQSQFDLGVIRYGSKPLPFVTAGIGPSLYLDSNWALDFQARTIMRQAPDPLSQSLRSASPIPNESSFDVNTRVGFDIFFSTKYVF